MIPLVILDLDGTLIGASGKVLPCVWASVERARESGVRFAVCTGRPGFGVAAQVARRLDPDTPHVFQSGAQVAYLDGNTVQASALKEAQLRALVKASRDLGAVLELYTPQNLYVERTTDLSQAHAKMIGVTAIVRDLQEVAAQEPVVRGQWVVPSERLDDVLGARVDGIESSVATSPALGGAVFVSLTRSGVSKRSAVELLCARLEIDPRHAMAVGDSAGDLGMLEAVGLPRVMGNATPDLRERFAEGVLGDVEACGVSEALEQARTQRAPSRRG